MSELKVVKMPPAPSALVCDEHGASEDHRSKAKNAACSAKPGSSPPH